MKTFQSITSFQKEHRMADGELLLPQERQRLWDPPTGVVIVSKRLEDSTFSWPRLTDGVYTISRSQFEALIEGLDWRKIRLRDIKAPTLAA